VSIRRFDCARRLLQRLCARLGADAVQLGIKQRGCRLKTRGVCAFLPALGVATFAPAVRSGIQDVG
jgi:hypothetical protein